MKQTTKSLLSLGGFIVLALVLATAAAWVGRDEEKKAEVKEKSAKLFEVDKAKVRELELKRLGVLVAQLKRESAAAPWKITAPASGALVLTINGSGYITKKETGPFEANKKNDFKVAVKVSGAITYSVA